MTATQLYHNSDLLTSYYDNRSKLSPLEYEQRLKSSQCLYIGKVNPLTSDSKLLQMFHFISPVIQIHPGLHKKQLTKESYLFIDMSDRIGAELLKHNANNMFIDQRNILADFDIGFTDGRQYGRGFSGGSKEKEVQVRRNAKEEGSFQRNKKIGKKY